jgi:hypothetical protein
MPKQTGFGTFAALPDHASGTVRKAQKVRLMMLMSSCISVPDRMHSRSHGMSSRADRSEMSKSRFISL